MTPDTQASRDSNHQIKGLVVRPAPDTGRANAALIRLLAGEWRPGTSRLAIAAGVTDRRKTVRIDGDAAMLTAALDAWAKAHQF